ncbi:MAG: nucleobase:cation symporter-2 family protein [Prevotella sp.]|nr:nucleobase:cation symporter-2 family protein [Prevotella sp.]
MESENHSQLVYGLEDRPPLRESLIAALQHLLAIVVAIITPALIISSALRFDVETTGFLVSMSLFVSGLSTFVQCHRFGPIGAGLLCIQGTSFSFINPIIAAGMLGMVNGKMDVSLGLSYIFGGCLVASVVEMAVSRLLPYARKVITPLVAGIVVTLIGLCLIKVGIQACGGGQAAVDNGTFGSLPNLGLATLVLLSIVAFNRSTNKFLRMGSIAIGIVIGCTVAYFTGMMDLSGLNLSEHINLPIPFKYGLRFDTGTIIALGLIYLVTSVEAFGDITANSLISGQPVEGKVFMKRAQGGILADGFNSFLAAVFNSFPNSIFAQNNGMIQLTGVASRYVGYYIAAILFLLGLFPIIGQGFSLIPSCVLGGATLLMFGTVAAAGIRIIASTPLNRKAILVMAISFSLGMSVELVPGILDKMPTVVHSIFASGITTGGIAAILSNAFIRIKEN